MPDVLSPPTSTFASTSFRSRLGRRSASLSFEMWTPGSAGSTSSDSARPSTASLRPPTTTAPPLPPPSPSRFYDLRPISPKLRKKPSARIRQEQLAAAAAWEPMPIPNIASAATVSTTSLAPAMAYSRDRSGTWRSIEAGSSSTSVLPGASSTHAHNSKVVESLQVKKAGLEGGDSFIYKRGGRKHHSFPVSECPYPLACDREALNLDIMDQHFLTKFNGSQSFIDWNLHPTPRRVLDLGCGSGSWVLDKAKEWPECHFVGFDIVPIQVSLKYHDKELATRVKWIHGNFLNPKLPFSDGEFDFVHVKQVSWGVPEQEWDHLLEELHRVIRPGGILEVIEEDIIFPTTCSGRELPLFRKSAESSKPPQIKPTSQPPSRPKTAESATSRLASLAHTRTPSHPSTISSSSGAQTSGSSRYYLSDNSTSPSSIRPFFSTASSTPPPLPPPKDLPPKLSLGSARLSFHMKALPPTPTSPLLSERLHSMFPIQLPEDSPDEPSPRVSEFAQLERLFESVFERRFINTRPTSLLPNLLNIHFTRICASPPIIRYYPSTPRRMKTHERIASEESVSWFSAESMLDRLDFQDGSWQTEPRHKQPLLQPLFISRSLDAGRRSLARGRQDRLPSFEESSSDLFESQEDVELHLHRVLKGVLACKEAMWEELSAAYGPAGQQDPATLVRLNQLRTDFDDLVERYRTAVQAQIPLPDVLQEKLKWKIPRKEPKVSRMDDPMRPSDASPSESGWGDSPDGLSKVPFRRMRIFSAFKAEA